MKKIKNIVHRMFAKSVIHFNTKTYSFLNQRYSSSIPKQIL